jgi:hypothetical protein
MEAGAAHMKESQEVVMPRRAVECFRDVYCVRGLRTLRVCCVYCVYSVYRQMRRASQTLRRILKKCIR